ncbi:hypothetical protein PI124_g1252 [Phytophthora idaei]|nr:hypothetical protein PI125_g9545 [Phytophthora idaei]KAG3173588.1 hypothetical protein PI126_g768 [Phytophthora idaei]KAG3254180.1 hypothetical protein PI124_g1252 [Phytophthora idaei]
MALLDGSYSSDVAKEDPIKEEVEEGGKKRKDGAWNILARLLQKLHLSGKDTKPTTLG